MKEPKLTQAQQDQLMQEVKHAFEHDNTDYDGMGNYGRFPPEPEHKPSYEFQLTDVLLIFAAVFIVAMYLIII